MILDNKTINEVKNFVNNYIEQSNRSTAWPYVYVVKQKQKVAVPIGCGEYTVYQDGRGDTPISKQEFNEMNEEMESNDEAMDWDDFEAIGDVEVVARTVQWFFTEKEALAYIKRDGHNLNEPFLYVDYCKRNTEAELILRTFFTIAGKDYEKEKG